jgi:dienelactone hydrolase
MLRAKHVSGVDVETEFLGGSPVSKALRELRAKNMRCRVLISAQAYDHGGPTSDAAHSLAKIGVDVRIAKANDKLAVAGTHAWIGSANASSTRPNPDAVEWSLTTANPRVAREIRSRFNQNWRASSALPR